MSNSPPLTPPTPASTAVVHSPACRQADPLRRGVLRVVPGALPGLAVWVFMSRFDAVIGRDDGVVVEGKRPTRGHDGTSGVDGSASTGGDAGSAVLRMREGWVLRGDDC